MKPKAKGNPDRVIVSAEEAQRERIAQTLAAQGKSAFGDPNERFDLSGDKAAMDDVGMVLKEPDAAELAARRNMELDAIATAGFGGGPQAAPMTQDLSKVAEPWGGTPQMEEKKQEVEPVFTMGSSIKEEVKQPEVKEEPKEEVQEPQAPAKPELSEDPVQRMHQISEIFKAMHANFPTGEQLVQMKNMMGDIFILDLDDKVFIYRYLKRQEWVQMNANEAYHNMRQDQKEDMIYNKCVVWPKLGPEQVAMLPAGCVSSIVGQIEQQSMFLDPRQLANVTIKL